MATPRTSRVTHLGFMWSAQVIATLVFLDTADSITLPMRLAQRRVTATVLTLRLAISRTHAARIIVEAFSTAIKITITDVMGLCLSTRATSIHYRVTAH